MEEKNNRQGGGAKTGAGCLCANTQPFCERPGGEKAWVSVPLRRKERLEAAARQFPFAATRGRAGSRGLKDRAPGGLGGRAGVHAEVGVRRISGWGSPEIVVGKRSSRGHLALPPAPAPRGLGEGQGRSEDLGGRCGERGAATPGCGRGEGRDGEAVKGPETRAVGSPTPAPTPGQWSPLRPAPRPAPRVRLGPAESGAHLPPPLQPPLQEGGAEKRGR